MKLRNELKGKAKPPTPVKQLSKEEEDAFIGKSASTVTDKIERDNPRSRVITGRGRPAAPGYHRTSMDLPQELYLNLKIAAAKRMMTLREIAVEAFKLWLDRNEKRVDR